MALDDGNGTAYAGLQPDVVSSPRPSSTGPGWPTGASAAAVDAAFLRAVTRAVRRINADKRRFVSYFMRDFVGHPEVEALSPDDFDLGRIQLKDPGPIPEAEARWAWEWTASGGVLEGPVDAAGRINRSLPEEAHDLAAAALAG